MRSLVISIVAILICFGTWSQVDNQLITNELIGTGVAPNSNLTINIEDNPTVDPLEKRVKKAWIDVFFTIDDIFLLGDAANLTVLDEYTIEVEITKYSDLNAGGLVVGAPEVYSMTINSGESKSLIRLDLTSFIANEEVKSIELQLANSPAVRTLGASLPSSDQVLINQYIDDKQKLRLEYHCQYGIDVRVNNGSGLSLASAPLILPINATTQNPGSSASRIVDFSWMSWLNFPNYEIQILRLFNIDDAKTSELDIRAKVNWSEALKIETTTDAKDVRLTVAEGSGFYVWRIRPIGNYFEGEYGDARNWGQWSDHAFWENLENNQNGEIELSTSSIANLPRAFYLVDPDDSKNWMYSRVIVEDNKVSEGMVYANNLLQPLQSQSYSSTTGQSIISQTVMDYLGRPSLSTLAVPVNNGGLNGYEDQFFLNGSNELYTALDFDEDANLYNPELAGQNGNNFEYYSSSNPDLSIPDAEGHVYSRTIFLPDGSGRVSEASGIGSVHAIGSNQTSKIFYATPSDDELIAIFGDEAPQAVNILKTISIDANGVANIAYTTIEGVTIATALSRNTPANLLDIDNLGSAGIFDEDVSSDVVINTYADQKIISSQVIGLEQATPVTIDYFRDCDDGFDIGGCATGDCQFSLRFIISNIVTGAVIKSNLISNLSQFNCNNAVPSNEFVWSSSDIIPGAIYTNGKIVTLPRGNWKIQKVVASTIGLSSVNDVSESQMFLGPLVDLVAQWMSDATSQDALTDFNVKVDELITNLANAHASATGNYDSPSYQAVFGTTYFADLVTDYDFPLDYTFNPDYTLSFELIDPANPALGTNNDQLVFSAVCCSDLGVNIPSQEKYSICESIETEMANNSFDVDDVQFSQIFRELYEEIIVEPALSSGVLIGEIPVYQSYWGDAAKGYDEKFGSTTAVYRTSMDDMIYHMMTDQYFTGNAEKIGNVWNWETPSNGDQRVYETNGTISQFAIQEKFGPYYQCDALYECWYASVKAYYELLKNNGSSYDIYDSLNVDSDNDAVPGGNDGTLGGGFSDDPNNGPDDQSIMDKLVSWIISSKMDKFSEDLDGGSNGTGAPKMAIQFNIPTTFLECAGYKFAAIIDVPKSDIQSASFLGMGEVNDLIFLGDKSSYLSGSTILATEFDEGPDPNSPFDDLMLDVTPERLMYSNIMSPVWAFKYYEYNPVLQVPSNSFTTSPNNEVQSPVDFDELSSVGSLELSQCYHNFSGLTVPFCNANFCTNGGHHNWNANDRYNFYKLIENANEDASIDCSVIQPDPNLVPFTCIELNTMIDEDFNAALQSCSDRADYFRNQIVTMLNNNCYEIVNCVDPTSPGNYISEAAIDAMVVEAVNSCGQYVTDLKASCTTGDCSTTYPFSVVVTCNVPVSGIICSSNERITELFDPTFHIEEKLERVMHGVFVPYGITSMCPGGTNQSLPNDTENCNELNEIQSPEINAGL